MRIQGFCCFMRYCRWCGRLYTPLGATDRDGFCMPAHKQALHRAYNKYVTTTEARQEAARNARKKGRKKKC